MRWLREISTAARQHGRRRPWATQKSVRVPKSSGLAKSKGLSRALNDIKRLFDEGEKLNRGLPASHDHDPLPELPQGAVIREGSGEAAKYHPVFELPNVVLDLDAEDSPHVRPFNKEDGLHQRWKWAHDPGLANLQTEARLHQQEFEVAAEAMSQAAGRPLGRQAISDHDIFTVALHDMREVGTASRPVHEMLEAHGVPQGTLRQGSSATIPFMLHRQRLAAQRLDENPPLRSPDSPAVIPFGQEVQECVTLNDLRRVFLHIASPSSANHVGSDGLDHIYKRCKELLQDLGKAKLTDHSVKDELTSFLGFLNNTTIYQLLRNIPLHPEMTLLGLQLSCDCGTIPSSLQYLQICLSMGFIGDHMESRMIISLDVARGILEALKQAGAIAIGTRQQLLKLLFGLDPDQEKLQSSLLGLDADLDRHKNPERHQLRLQLLGQLGALRLLWRCGTGSDETVLVDAFHRFAQLISGVEGVDITTTNDDIDNDIRLDLRTMNTVEAHHRQIYPHNNAPGTPGPAISELLSSEEILAAFKEQHIGDAVRRFNDLIRGQPKA